MVDILLLELGPVVIVVVKWVARDGNRWWIIAT